MPWEQETCPWWGCLRQERCCPVGQRGARLQSWVRCISGSWQMRQIWPDLTCTRSPSRWVTKAGYNNQTHMLLLRTCHLRSNQTTWVKRCCLHALHEVDLGGECLGMRLHMDVKAAMPAGWQEKKFWKTGYFPRFCKTSWLRSCCAAGAWHSEWSWCP